MLGHWISKMRTIVCPSMIHTQSTWNFHLPGNCTSLWLCLMGPDPVHASLQNWYELCSLISSNKVWNPAIAWMMFTFREVTSPSVEATLSPQPSGCWSWVYDSPPKVRIFCHTTDAYGSNCQVVDRIRMLDACCPPKSKHSNNYKNAEMRKMHIKVWRL